MNLLKALLRSWKIHERFITKRSPAEPQPEEFIQAPTNEQLASIAEELIDRFREFYSSDPSASIKRFVTSDIARIENLADRSRLDNWVKSASSVNLFEYAVAIATPINSLPHVRDTVLIGMDRIFCDLAGDLPREATGAITIGESLQDIRNYLASKLDD